MTNFFDNGRRSPRFRTLSCRVPSLFCVFVFLLAWRFEHQCVALTPALHDGDSDAECRPLDIQLYTWSGSDFQSGECWHQGHRFVHGATWGRADSPDAPYCVCEQGKVRIFYSQRQQSAPKPVTVADPLTLLRPTHGSSPTPQDLAKWPLPNLQQRTAICSPNRLGRRVRSRDGCIGCKCSANGHWLCRKPPPTVKRNQTDHRRQQTTARTNPYVHSNVSNLFNVRLRVTTLRARSECPTNSSAQFCVLIARLPTGNITDKVSRYVEIPRDASWFDPPACTKCTCTSTGQLKCEFLHQTCRRPCLLQKARPIPLMYYFPPDSKWVTPPHDKCRSCQCINGQRKCVNCDQVLKIAINTPSSKLNKDVGPSRSAVGEYSLVASKSPSAQITPCVLQTNVNSQRLIAPGQQTWFNGRCYSCPKRGGPLTGC